MASSHPRNLAGLEMAVRCGAKTRKGALCRSPAISGAARCRMHGGRGSGAPHGNRNAQKHGAFNARVCAIKARSRVLAMSMRRALAEEKNDL
ncbi:MAG: hypothetical protein KKD08_03880 [Alphaproteobacteria bacterium]|jgi:periplasmic glucans biosynthesis protein|nr:hypothetical protein [Alphaproteobacteria bacterium]